MPVPQLRSQRTCASPTAVLDLVRRLPADEREAVTMARAEHLTYREVAAALGVSEETAKRRIRSGLLRLRAELVRLDAVAS